MTPYKAYPLDRKGRPRRGRWLDARSDAEARRQAVELCEDDTAVVEVWQETRAVDEIDCEPERS